MNRYSVLANHFLNRATSWVVYDRKASACVSVQYDLASVALAEAERLNKDDENARFDERLLGANGPDAALPAGY